MSDAQYERLAEDVGDMQVASLINNLLRRNQNNQKTIGDLRRHIANFKPPSKLEVSRLKNALKRNNRIINELTRENLRLLDKAQYLEYVLEEHNITLAAHHNHVKE